MRTLLIVFHTHGVKTAQMAEAVERGARRALAEAEAVDEVRVVVKRAADAGPEDLLAAVGATLWFERESDLDAVTAVSGSGPAYVFYAME